MAILIEPDGTENVILPIADAIDYCAARPGWTWALYSDAGVPG